jgi:hypothetical protein
MAANGTWHFILPGGTLHRWTGTGPGATFVSSSPLVATLDARFHADPALLHNAQPATTGDPGSSSVAIAGSRLTLTIDSGFTGELRVEVTASDGAEQTTCEFTVSVNGPGSTVAPLASTNAASSDSSVLYVNFDGAALTAEDLQTWAGNDWDDHLSTVIDPDHNGVLVEALWPDWAKRDVFIADVLTRLNEELLPYGLAAERHVGGAVDGLGVTTVFVGVPTIAGAGVAWVGLAGDVDHGDDNATDVAFAMPLWMSSGYGDSVIATANLILHEAGHTWGLDEADPSAPGDLMASGTLDRLLNPDATFVEWPDRNAAESLAGDDTAQSSTPAGRSSHAGAGFRAVRIGPIQSASRPLRTQFLAAVAPHSNIAALAGNPRDAAVSAAAAAPASDWSRGPAVSSQDAHGDSDDSDRAAFSLPEGFSSIDEVLDAVFADDSGGSGTGSLFDALLRA